MNIKQLSSDGKVAYVKARIESILEQARNGEI